MWKDIYRHRENSSAITAAGNQAIACGMKQPDVVVCHFELIVFRDRRSHVCTGCVRALSLILPLPLPLSPLLYL